MRAHRQILGMICGVIFLLSGSEECFGSGFAINCQGARANALGLAVIGRADDPSAVFYNPAGITQLPGLQVSAGATAYAPMENIITRHGGATIATEAKNDVWIPPHLYLTYQWLSQVWLGFGVFSPFGLGIDYDQSWHGRYNAYSAGIQSASFNPNIAIKLNDYVSIAAGMEVVWLQLQMKQKIDASRQNNPNVHTFDVDQDLKGDGFGYGFNLAVHYKPVDWMAIGVSYRSQVKESLEGDAHFTKPVALQNIKAFGDTEASTSIILPDRAFLGFLFKPVERWSVEVGATWTDWSTFRDLIVTYRTDRRPRT